MKIKAGYMLREVADTRVVVAVGPEATRFHGMIRLNECGALLYKRLGEGASRRELLDTLLETYDVDEARADADLDAFLASLRQAGLLDEAS